MKIYYHPASTTSRPVVLFAAENGNEVARIDRFERLFVLLPGEQIDEL